MKPVAIIGAGITGLTAAFYLKRKGVPVTVYEASDRVGGAIQSLRADGYLAEFGPNTILETSPKVTQLVATRPGVAAARSRSQGRGALCGALPAAHRDAGLAAGLLHDQALYRAGQAGRAARAVRAARGRDGKEESVAEFVVRRLGQEFLDHAIDALVAGVYAGDPYKLSVPQAFPKLGQLEARYGSLIKGQIFGARERKRRGEVAKDRAPKFSFDEGLAGAAGYLARAPGRSGAPEHRRHPPHPDARGLDAGLARARPADAGRAQRGDLRGHGLQAGGTGGPGRPCRCTSTRFAEIRYPPVASVVLGFRREDVAHPCAGFGMLIPKVEGFKILGTIFSSSLFPNRAPGGAPDADQLRRRRAVPGTGLAAAGQTVRADLRGPARAAGREGQADLPAQRVLSEGDPAI